MMNNGVCIIGAGLAGLSIIHHLDSKHKTTIFEKESVPGGLCRSISVDGHTFDIGGSHVIFTRDEYVNNLIMTMMKDNLIKHRRGAFIFLNNTYVEYPFEVNLRSLSKEVIDECISGVENLKDEKEPENFEEWIYSTMGAGISKYYMIPYNQKIWDYDLKKMNCDWIKGRVPKPDIEEMKKGASEDVQKEYGPNAYFHFPKTGGTQALVDVFAKNKEIVFNSEITGIKTSDGLEVEVNGRDKKVYDTVFSTLPLPEIVKLIDNVPDNVKQAADDLVYSSIVCTAIKTNSKLPEGKHWIYFPDANIPFTRIGFLSNYSPNMSPEGESLVLVEKTYNKDKTMNKEEQSQKALDSLIELGIIADGEILHTSQFKYAYVVYDLNHSKNKNIIIDFLKSLNIIPVGRFAEWEYFNMDKAILAGKRAAEGM